MPHFLFFKSWFDVPVQPPQRPAVPVSLLSQFVLPPQRPVHVQQIPHALVHLPERRYPADAHVFVVPAGMVVVAHPLVPVAMPLRPARRALPALPSSGRPVPSSAGDDDLRWDRPGFQDQLTSRSGAHIYQEIAETNPASQPLREAARPLPEDGGIYDRLTRFKPQSDRQAPTPRSPARSRNEDESPPQRDTVKHVHFNTEVKLMNPPADDAGGSGRVGAMRQFYENLDKEARRANAGAGSPAAPRIRQAPGAGSPGSSAPATGRERSGRPRAPR